MEILSAYNVAKVQPSKSTHCTLFLRAPCALAIALSSTRPSNISVAVACCCLIFFGEIILRACAANGPRYESAALKLYCSKQWCCACVPHTAQLPVEIERLSAGNSLLLAVNQLKGTHMQLFRSSSAGGEHVRK